MQPSDDVVASNEESLQPSDDLVHIFLGATEGTVYVWEAVSCTPIKEIGQDHADYGLLHG